jgi:hypothetical protein
MSIFEVADRFRRKLAADPPGGSFKRDPDADPPSKRPGVDRPRGIFDPFATENRKPLEYESTPFTEVQEREQTPEEAAMTDEELTEHITKMLRPEEAAQAPADEPKKPDKRTKPGDPGHPTTEHVSDEEYAQALKELREAGGIRQKAVENYEMAMGLLIMQAQGEGAQLPEMVYVTIDGKNPRYWYLKENRYVQTKEKDIMPLDVNSKMLTQMQRAISKAEMAPGFRHVPGLKEEKPKEQEKPKKRKK